MINRVVLLGRITRDPELRRSQSGVAIVPFTIAVDGLRKDSEGNRITNFIPCRALGQTAEILAKYTVKGSLIAIEGYLQTSRFERRDGSMASSMDVVVSSLTLCDSRNKNTQKGSANFPIDEPSNEPSFNDDSNSDVDYSQMDLADDDLPF